VPPTKEKCEYELAKHAHVAKLAYLLKLLKDASVELWVFNLCQCLLQWTCKDVKLSFGGLFWISRLSIINHWTRVNVYCIYVRTCICAQSYSSIMWERGVLELAFQLNFWVASDTCNSLYLYVMSAIGQVARVATHRIYDATHYNSIATLSHQFSTTMQLPYDYNHNVILTSFFIHPSKFNTWYYEDFSWFFWNIDIHHPLWLFVLSGLGLWHMAP